MTLEEYIEELHQSAEAFRTYWQVERAKAPDQFPQVLEPGAWDEQYSIFNWDKLIEKKTKER